jgi:hypothetical protein
MRIVKEISTTNFKITVYFWNEKYLLKFENGVNELVYKIKRTDLTSESDIDAFFSDQNILSKTEEAFTKMQEAQNTFYSII